MKIWEPKTSETLWATPGLLRDSFTIFTVSYWSLQRADHSSREVLPTVVRRYV